MNALDLLKKDHQRVDQLLKEAEATESERQLELFQKIKAELEAHAHIEEAIFYPYMKENGDQKLTDIILEGIEEHRQIKMFLRELDNLNEGSEKQEPKLKVLSKTCGTIAWVAGSFGHLGEAYHIKGLIFSASWDRA